MYEIAYSKEELDKGLGATIYFMHPNELFESFFGSGKPIKNYISHLFCRDRMILLKMEQEIIDFISDNKYVKWQFWLICKMYLNLVFGLNYSLWKGLGMDKAFNMFADVLSGDAIGA